MRSPPPSIAVATYEVQTIFPTCPYNLDEVVEYWVRWKKLIVRKDWDSETEEFEGVDIEADFKRPDHLRLDPRHHWV
tara:strand:- start:65 stop:295 length:231 start_codon:yes stop_codon:yes gene_type:complete